MGRLGEVKGGRLGGFLSPDLCSAVTRCGDGEVWIGQRNRPDLEIASGPGSFASCRTKCLYQAYIA
jgi:hypothetical protein